MSTQETTSPANWAFSYARRVLVHRWRKAKGFAVLNFNILCRPRWAGKNVIVGDGPTDLLHALQYFSKAFALTFLIYVVASRFKLYEGDSEWRDLVTIFVKLLIVVAIVYLLTRALPDRMSLSRLLQAALYVGGTYIIFEALLSIPVSYLSLIVPSENRELDIFGTERERCLAHSSPLYWLLRGDLKFFLYSDVWKPADWTNWLLDNYHHPLAIPFMFIFALMLGLTRKASLILAYLFSLAAFVIAVESVEFGKRQFGNALAQRDEPKCVVDFLDQVTKNYAPSLIARQIAYKINNDSLKTHTYFAPLVALGTDLTLAMKFKPDVEPTLVTKLSWTVQQAYCSNGNIYWITARRINSRLALLVQNDDNTVLYKQLITPKDCPAWPSPQQ